ncbi:endoplasmic reticulum membrane protein [Ceratobasidium theobromae]|uniref:Endoplasmic reticulum membrane protein n=1 Tax=Ceratobasidium theobromae TaxID=1582974 RepID=A0A5N5QV79_9AGAM|nr:endoplasmic reticulum membrane protein [Ceratobasidium theobromae]
MSAPSLLSFLAPAPAVFPQEEYDGFQLRWKNLVFRPAEFVYEGFGILAIAVYIALYFFGKRVNENRASKWFAAHLPVYAEQFSRPANGSVLLSDGASDYFAYSTGRRGVHFMHTIFTMLPRHDIFQIIFQKLYGLIDLQYAPQDEVVLDVKLHDKDGLNGEGKGFVWGVVAKSEMQALRKKRWDLSFTKTTDNAAVAPTLSVMAEVADITDVMLKSAHGQRLATLLNTPSVVKHFKYLLITDQPSERPESGPVPTNQRERHLLLSLIVPEPSQSSDTVALVKEVFSLVDAIDQKPGFKVETFKKLKKTRVDLDAELLREAEKEKRDEAEEKKAAEKRKAAEERLARLSAAEQKKYEERERKKAAKKSQAKMIRK